MRHITINLLVLMLSAVSLGGCVLEDYLNADDENTTQPPGGTDPNRAPKADVLHKSESCDGFKTYLTQNLIEQYLENNNRYWVHCPGCGFREGLVDPVAGPATTTGTAGGTAASDSVANPGSVTGTNNQEAGVDELDKMKTDSLGNMYLLEGNKLSIIDAFPPQNLRQLSSLDLPDSGIGLFLDEANKTLVVLTNAWDKVPFNDAVSGSVYFSSVQQINVLLVDISNLSVPQITRQFSFEGNYQSSRFIKNRLHLVLNYWLQNVDQSFATRQFNEDLNRYWQAKNLKFDSLNDEIAALRAELAAAITVGVSALDVSKVLPRMQIDSGENTALLACNDVYHPEVSLNDSGIVLVISMDSDGTNQSAVGAMASGAHVYASENSLYVAQSSNNWWWTIEDQKTAIHKFSLSPTSISYIASGLVAGIVKDQFSFSEYQDYLRVATTDTFWPLDSTRMQRHNNLFILKQTDTSLTTYGSVEKFAPDEQIFSSRFVGDKGFIVTFRQIDPLFAFDLSDPAKPVLKGELEIPGFSTYMHPVGESHLLTIGRAGNANGATNQMQLQLFDVSDLSKPVLVDAHVPEILNASESWTYSMAEYDHHAFTYSNEDQVLAIPLNYYNWSANTSFAGIATFKIDLIQGIAENGSVEHSDFVTNSGCSKTNGGTFVDTSCAVNYYSQYVLPDRSVIMRDATNDARYLYSISALGVKANDLNQMENVLGSLKIKQ